MTQIILNVESFRPQPDDIIVARAQERITPSAIEHIRDTLKERFPDHHVIVLDNGLGLAATPAEARRANPMPTTAPPGFAIAEVNRMCKTKRILTAPVTLPLWLAALMAACLLITCLIGDIERWGITGILVFAACVLTGWGIGHLSTTHKA